MYKVIYVKESRQKGYISIGLVTDGKRECYTVTNTLYGEIGSPIKGDGLDGDTLKVLIEDDERFRALRRALSLLSYADNSERTLTLKLLRAGFSRSAVRFAVEDCVAHGYINEREQLMRLVSVLANSKLRGPMYIKQSLMGKGYSAQDIDAAIHGLCEKGEIDFKESLHRLAEKMGANDPEARRALAYKYGFREL